MLKKNKLEFSRFEELDALRGLAIITVVLFHYTTKFQQSYNHSKVLWFYLPQAYGVNFLFMLSGFVIFMSLQRKKNPSDFALGRVARIYPTYVASVLMTSIVLSVCVLPGKQVNLSQILINLTMVPYVFGVQKVDGVYWALYVEISFYILIFTLFKLNFLHKIKMLSIGWLTIQAGCQFIEISGLGRIPGKSYLLLSHGHLFIAGISFYFLMKDKSDLGLHFIILACILSQWLQHNQTKTMAIIVFVFIFYLFIYGFMGFIKNRILSFIGSISYALYLLHQNIGYVFIYKMERNGFSVTVSIVIALIISIGLAFMVTSYVEKPASRLITRLYRQRFFSAKF